MNVLAEAMDAICEVDPLSVHGSVRWSRGKALGVAGLRLPIGTPVLIAGRVEEIEGEIVGFDEDTAVVLPYGSIEGVRCGDPVIGHAQRPAVRVGEALLGRVLDAVGRPIDGGGPIHALTARPLSGAPSNVFQHLPPDKLLGTGNRVVDALCPVGGGQRVLVVSRSGSGKSAMLRRMAVHAAADVVILAMIDVRASEVGEAVSQLAAHGQLARTVVVAVASGEPAVLYVRAAQLATSIGQYFREQGRNALLLMDSLTGFANAHDRLVRICDTSCDSSRHGPDTVTAASQLIERVGRMGHGTLTGLYSVRDAGTGSTDARSLACLPVADGRIVLHPRSYEVGGCPVIDVIASTNRNSVNLMDETHQIARTHVLRLIEAYRQIESMAPGQSYRSGASRLHDLAMEMKPRIDRFLFHATRESVTPEHARAEVLQIAAEAAQRAEEIDQEMS